MKFPFSEHIFAKLSQAPAKIDWDSLIIIIITQLINKGVLKKIRRLQQ